VALLGELRRLTLDVMLQTTFGARDERLAILVGDALAVARSAPRMAAMALGPVGWRGFERRIAAVDVALRAAIAQRRAAPEPGDDLLGTLLGTRDAAGAPLADDEVRDHLVTLLAAGHDTTAAAAAWAIERLAHRPTGSWRCATAATRSSTPWPARRCACARCSRWRRASWPRRSRWAAVSCPRRARRPLHLPAAPPGRRLSRPDGVAARALAGRARAGARPAAWIPFGGGVRRVRRRGLRARRAARAAAGRHRRGRPRARRGPGERMRRRGVTLHPGAGARVVLRDAV
jgi:hypothetical protein